MNKPPTTLGRFCPNGLVPIGLKEAVERVLAQAEHEVRANPQSPAGDRTVRALSQLRDYVGQNGPSPGDPRTYALWVIASNMGTLDDFDLTPTQSRLLAQLASTMAPVPSPDATYTELVCAAVEDMAEISQQRIAAANSRADSAEERGEENRAAALEVERVESELNEARNVIAGLNGDLEEAQGTITFLRKRSPAQVEGGSPAPEDAPSAPKKKPRRTKIDGEEGLYVTDTGKLCIGYTDAEGKQRWQTLGAFDPAAPVELPEARDLRASLMGQPYDSAMADKEPVTV